MNKILLGLLLGTVLGAIDGASAWFTPAVRAQLAGIIIGSTIKGLIAGVAIVATIVAFGLVGPFLIHQEATRTTAFAKDLKPSLEHFLGTDSFGRDIMAVHVVDRTPPHTEVKTLLADSVSRGEQTSWWHQDNDLYLVELQPITSGSGAEQHAQPKF